MPTAKSSASRSSSCPRCPVDQGGCAAGLPGPSVDGASSGADPRVHAELAGARVLVALCQAGVPEGIWMERWARSTSWHGASPSIGFVWQNASFDTALAGWVRIDRSGRVAPEQGDGVPSQRSSISLEGVGRRHPDVVDAIRAFGLARDNAPLNVPTVVALLSGWQTTSGVETLRARAMVGRQMHALKHWTRPSIGRAPRTCDVRWGATGCRSRARTHVHWRGASRPCGGRSDAVGGG